MNDKILQLIIKMKDEASGQLAKLGNAFSSTAKEIQKDAKGIEKSTQSAQEGIEDLAMVSGVLAAGFGFLGKSILDATVFNENAITSFKVMTGSMESAQAHLAELTEFAKTTPFTLEGLTENSIKLHAFGFETEEVIPTLTSLGNIASAIGMEKLPNLTYALGQVRSAGVLTGQDLMQFTSAGVGMAGAIATIVNEQRGLTLTAGDVKQETAKLGITYDIVAEALRRMTSEGGLYYNMMAEGAKTLSGQWSNFEDQMSQTITSIGISLKPALQDIMEVILLVGGAVQDFTMKYPELTKNILLVSAAVVGLTALFAGVTLILPTLTAAWTIFTVAVGAILTPFAAFLAVGVLLTAWIVSNTNFINSFTGSFRSLDEQTGATKGIMSALKDLFSILGDVISSLTGTTIDSSGAMSLFGDIIGSGVVAGVKALTYALEILAESLRIVYDLGQGVGLLIGKVTGAQVSAPQFKSKTAKSLSGKRALGGYVSRGNSYLVGERQPEIFSPSRSGYISNAGGGVNITVSGNSFSGTNADIVNQITRAIASQLNNSIRV